MTKEEIQVLIPDAPIDGRIVEYWRIESADTPYPIHYICRYDLNTLWREHPWGKARPGSRGADFEDAWSIWVEYSPEGGKAPSGRVAGWTYLRSYLSLPDTYASAESAAVALMKKKEEAIEALQRRAERLQKEIGRLRDQAELS